MLAVFSDGTEVIVCEVNGGEPITKDYFTGEGGDERKREDYDYALIEGPVRIEHGSLKTEPEKVLSGSV